MSGKRCGGRKRRDGEVTEQSEGGGKQRQEETRQHLIAFILRSVHVECTC